MGRRSHNDPHRRINLYINESILTALQILYFDPARGKARYGAMSELVNLALKEHLRMIKENGKEEQDGS